MSAGSSRRWFERQEAAETEKGKALAKEARRIKKLKTLIRDNRNADMIDGYSRDDIGESADY